MQTAMQTGLQERAARGRLCPLKLSANPHLRSLTCEGAGCMAWVWLADPATGSGGMSGLGTCRMLRPLAPHEPPAPASVPADVGLTRVPLPAGG